MLKLLENTFATLRIILVANGKKTIGAFFMILMSLTWILSINYVVINLNKDYFKVVAFVLGSGFGSFIGSLLEEKFAIGDVLITFTTDSYDYKLFNNVFDSYDKNIIKFNDNKYYFEILCKRKKKSSIIKAIKNNNRNIIIKVFKINVC